MGRVSLADKAEDILRRHSKGAPLHYRRLTEIGIEEGLVVPKGSTPEASLNSAVTQDIKKKETSGEPQRFRSHGKGFYSLARPTDPLASAIEAHNGEVRDRLREALGEMHPKAFEHLIEELLISLEFEDVEVTKYVGDRGIDLRATLAVGGITDVQTAIQAKRHTSGSVGGPVVRELRGGLGPHERGLIITLSRFSKEARREASERDRSPISLVDGEQLLDLLIQNQIGVNATSRSILELDEGFFTEDATPESGELPSAAASGSGLSGGPSSSQVLSLWPLPGGANAWKDSLDQMLQHVAEAAPTMKQAIAWLIASFEQLESTNTARGYWQVPRSLGLIETRGEQLGLTAEGSEYLEDPTREHLLRIAEYRIVGFEKIVHWLSERPHTAQDLLSRAQDELGVEWESQQQILYRLGWLEVLGAAKKSGNSWSPQ